MSAIQYIGVNLLFDKRVRYAKKVKTIGLAVGPRSGTNSQKCPKQFFFHCRLEVLPSLLRVWTALYRNWLRSYVVG